MIFQSCYQTMQNKYYTKVNFKQQAVHSYGSLTDYFISMAMVRTVSQQWSTLAGSLTKVITAVKKLAL